MALTRVGFVGLPPFRDSGFDHGDVHPASRRIFVAHTAEGAVEVIDGEALVHVGTIPGCPEASGVLCAQDEALVFAAARGAGKVLVIDPGSLVVVTEIATGPRPNGLAWNGRGGTLLVADVEGFHARLLAAGSGELVGQVELPGRPRWCVYDAAADRFLVNIRDPACVASIAGEPPRIVDRWVVSSAGPHGLDLDVAGGRHSSPVTVARFRRWTSQPAERPQGFPSPASPTPSGTTRSGSCSTWLSESRALWT